MSPSLSPLHRLREYLRGLLLSQQQKSGLDLEGKTRSIIATQEKDGRLKRLFEKAKEEEVGEERIREELGEKAWQLVNESRQESDLREVVQDHERSLALLGPLQKETRRLWNNFHLAILGTEAVLAFLLASFLAHLGITVVVLKFVPQFWAALATLLLGLAAFLGVGSYSGAAARQRARNAEYDFRFRQWLQVASLYVFVAILASWWGASSFEEPPAIESLVARTAGLGILLPALYVGYRRLKPGYLTWQAKVKTDAKPREQELKEALGRSERDAKRIIRLLNEIAVDALERKYKVARPALWQTKVPDYPLKDCWRKLSEQYESIVNTDALDQLEGYVKVLETASIGIAGERGAGKTSVMHSLRNRIEPKPPGAELPDPNSRGFVTIWISAPTAIAEKEFLLSVLAKLATRVGARLTGKVFWPKSSPEEESRRADGEHRHMVWAVGVGAAAGLVYLAVLWAEGLIWTDWERLALTPAIVLAAPLILWADRWLRPQELHERRPAERPLLHATNHLLDELWFEQKETTSSGISAALQGLNLSASTSRERSRKPFTLPHLVQLWDDYISNVVTAPGVFEKVVVFIDEVDKIKETAEIGKFMRILKTLFKPLRLFFVVSISEDAYEQFRARGVRKEQRNEFDSSFDQTVRVNRMGYEKTGEILDRRILGDPLPRPFVQLIWFISRGNARDTIRAARDVLEKYQKEELSLVTRELVKGYVLRPLLEHSEISLRKKPVSGDAASLFQTLARISELILENPAKARQSLGQLDKFLRRESDAVAKGETKREESPLRELEQIKADLYHALTLCETFDGSAGMDRFKEIGSEGKRNCLGPLLVRAQRQLEARMPELACRTLNEFHDELRRIPPSGGSQTVSAPPVLAIPCSEK